ncbi:hypothetical protein K438DRAFT_491208 [Mycena galopus ATCC 62051]|nr:hypothetical protein K438DRAFT_491208 [Mycena galopus ATCC 62051]
MEDREWSRLGGEKLREYSLINTTPSGGPPRQDCPLAVYFRSDEPALESLPRDVIRPTNPASECLCVQECGLLSASDGRGCRWKAVCEMVTVRASPSKLLGSARHGNGRHGSTNPPFTAFQRSEGRQVGSHDFTLERVSRTTRNVVSSSQESRLYQFRRMMECLWTTRGVPLWNVPRLRRTFGTHRMLIPSLRDSRLVIPTDFFDSPWKGSSFSSLTRNVYVSQTQPCSPASGTSASAFDSCGSSSRITCDADTRQCL